MKKTLLTMACSMAFIAFINAATVTWDGGAATTNWMDASNWDTDALPTTADDVLIDGFTVTLGITTTVQRVYVLGSGMLTIDGGSTLNIDGFTGNDEGFEVNNSATVINNGTVNVTNILGGTGADGLYVRGTFINIGSISIDGIGQHGLYIQRGNFTNSVGATITITNTGQLNSDGDGLYVDDSSGVLGLMTNQGTLTVNATTGDDAIYVNDGTTFINEGLVSLVGTASSKNAIRMDDGGIFNNLTGATFNVDGFTDDQILIDNNNAIFNNSGTINLINSDSGDAGLYVIDNGTFINMLGGIVNITDAENYGIQIDAKNDEVPSNVAEIINNGQITVTGGVNDGLRMQDGGLFTNNASGVLSFISVGDESIQIDDNTNNSTFDNFGTVDMLNSFDHGMELFGTFNNKPGALFKGISCNDDGIRVQNAGLFTNDGAIIIDGSGDDEIETDALTNFVNSATATFAPGSSPGSFTIRQDFDLGASVVTFEIDGTTAATEYDQILNKNSINTLTISGATANLVWGYTPAIGDCFKIIDDSGQIAGPWGAITSSDPSIEYSVDYFGNSAEVEICVTAILPVELINFTGEKTAEGTQLSWQTASEINNDGFEIERSSDGSDWTRIGFTKGKGDSHKFVTYSYLDNSPSNGTNYYRLKQMDFDGKFEYSRTVSVNNRNEKSDITLYPNPVRDVLHINMNTELENVKIQLYNSNGKTIWTSNSAVTQIPFEDYSSGIYFLEVVSSSNRTIQKIIK